MADQIAKILRKASRKDREKLLQIMRNIKQKNIAGYQIKKLSGAQKVFRIRAGDFRIIFEEQDKKLVVKEVRRRDDQTYRNY